MANDTTVTIVGNLTGDPELRITPTGTSVCKFAVAATPRHYDKASGEWRDGDSLFLNCTAWRDLADHAAESLTRGTRVIVTGRLHQSRWETPEGEKRSGYELQVEEVGPSLRFANAKVQKLTRASAGADAGPADDAWHTATPASASGRGPVGAAADPGADRFTDSAPPF